MELAVILPCPFPRLTGIYGSMSKMAAVSKKVVVSIPDVICGGGSITTVDSAAMGMGALLRCTQSAESFMQLASNIHGMPELSGRKYLPYMSHVSFSA